VSALLKVRGLVKKFGGLVATNELDLDVTEGEIHALIGPNGAGKSTLVNQLSGEQRPNAGTIFFGGEDMLPLSVPRRVRRGLTRSFQITSILPDFSVLENVALVVQVGQGHGFRFWRDARRDPSILDPARQMLERMGLAARAGVRAEDLSHGEQRQLELAMALATKPRMLLLDEPMAGLGPVESQEMTRALLALKGAVTILLIEHDMDAVFALADRVTALVYGRAIASGTPAEIRENAEVRAAYLGDADEVS
jgi:branched-chain amino acid transport system ATP-binding protein